MGFGDFDRNANPCETRRALHRGAFWLRFLQIRINLFHSFPFCLSHSPKPPKQLAIARVRSSAHRRSLNLSEINSSTRLHAERASHDARLPAARQSRNKSLIYCGALP